MAGITRYASEPVSPGAGTDWTAGASPAPKRLQDGHRLRQPLRCNGHAAYGCASFHKRRVPGTNLSTNFSIAAAGHRGLTTAGKGLCQQSHFLRATAYPSGMAALAAKGDTHPSGRSSNDRAAIPRDSFLTIIQQIPESREAEQPPLNAVDALRGRKPVQDLTAARPLNAGSFPSTCKDLPLCAER